MNICMVLRATIVLIASIACISIEKQTEVDSCDSHSQDAENQAAKRVLIQRGASAEVAGTQSMRVNVSSEDFDRAWFQKYSTGGCVGRNELGRHKVTLEKCQRKCLSDARCVSFEFRKTCSDTSKQKCCQLSKSCAYSQTVQDSKDRYDYFEKKFPKLSECQEVKLKVGTSGNENEKCVPLDEKYYCGHGQYNRADLPGARFSVARVMHNLCTKRVDRNTGWGHDLRLSCIKSNCLTKAGKCGTGSTVTLKFDPTEWWNKCLMVETFLDCEFVNLPKGREAKEFKLYYQGLKVCVSRVPEYGPGAGWDFSLKLSCKRLVHPECSRE